VLTDYIESVPGKRDEDKEQLLKEKDEMINDLIRKIAEVASHSFRIQGRLGSWRTRSTRKMWL
jgi:hypothetical protein